LEGQTGDEEPEGEEGPPARTAATKIVSKISVTLACIIVILIYAKI
jgi:hypothetical protein